MELDKVKLPYVCKDLNHLLRKIDEINRDCIIEDEDLLLVSFDIVNMFPSINKSFGIEQCKTHLEKRESPIFSTACILKALEITLDNKITQFEGILYKQCKGTAMGPPNACSYADVTMNELDKQVNEGNKWPEALRPLCWIRFRDDVLALWTHGREALERFLNWLNKLFPGILFTMKFSKQLMEYLNTIVYIKNGKLHTRPFSKPCDTHTYLIPSSCHATHTIKNIRYSIALTIYKIASEPAE